MNGKERISRQLNHQPVDIIGASEEFWSFTQQKWVNDGKIAADTNLLDHFGLDLDKHWSCNLGIDPEFKDVVLAEDDETRTVLNGNGAKLRYCKTHASTPEHLGYAIATREDWLEKAKPFLKPTANRFSRENYRAKKAACDEAGRFFFASGVNAFEAIHPITGHENLLVGMALDPEWVTEMADLYASLIIALYEELFALEGKPDGIWFYEDMGFKGRPFMSPEMYRELIMPAHKRTCDWAHSHGLKVVMHSCGYIRPLLPLMIESGIDALQAMEVKAGMDVLEIYEQFGDRIALMGGLDVRAIATNDKAWVKRELETKIPILKKRNGFILHSDHSIPESTEYETYKYFLDLGRELGRQ